MREDKTLPISFKVGYRVIKIFSVKYDADFHTQMGQFDNYIDRITIFLTGDPHKDVNTMIHELGHVIYEQYILSDAKAERSDKKVSDMVREGDREIAEERIVNSIANGYTEILTRNPKLREWMWNKLDG
jgi:Zn-dependent M32 family carboxypeptidase